MKTKKGQKMKNQYTQFRIENCNNQEKYIKEISHNLRFNIQTSQISQDIKNIFYLNGKTTQFLTSDLKNHKEYFENLFKERLELHKKLYKKSFKRNLQPKIQTTTINGVFTLSDSIDDLWKEKPKEVWEKGVKTIQNMCKELNIKLHYVVLHLDEDGLPHFHFQSDNFDNDTGEVLGISKNKNNLGEKVQDLSEIYFKEFGFTRGISKKKSNKRHLTTQEYKEYMKNLEKVQELEKTVEILEEKVENNQKTLASQKQKILDLEKKFKIKQSEMTNEIKILYSGVVKLYSEKDENKFLRLLNRYLGKNDKKLEIFIKKHSKIIKRIEEEDEIRRKEESRRLTKLHYLNLEEEKQRKLEEEQELLEDLEQSGGLWTCTSCGKVNPDTQIDCYNC